MKLEVVVVPVSDVDRAKDFYQALGWRLDADFVTGPDSRVIQMNPEGLRRDLREVTREIRPDWDLAAPASARTGRPATT